MVAKFGKGAVWKRQERDRKPDRVREFRVRRLCVCVEGLYYAFETACVIFLGMVKGSLGQKGENGENETETCV